MRAAVYLRISDDPLLARRGVERQREDCLTECARRGWEPDVFEDNDIRASTRTKKDRPAYREMLAAVRAGAVQAIVAWDGSRLHRRPAELEEFISLIELAKIPVVQVKGGDYDFANADDRFKARVIGSAAALEAEKTGERVARSRLSDAQAGRPSPGGRRAWGFLPDGVTHDPVEVSQIRDAAERILAGQSASSVARALGKRPAGVTKALLSPRLIGQRIYRGQTFPASWEPIIDVDTQAGLRAVLRHRDPDKEPGGVRARKYLLSGFVRCGACGTRMSGTTHHGSAAYKCPLGCTRRKATIVEAKVLAYVLPRETLADTPPKGVDPALAGAVTGLEARIADLDLTFLEGAVPIPAEVYARQRANLTVQLDDARTAYAAAVANCDEAAWKYVQPVGDTDIVFAVWEAWETADLRQKRATIAKHVDHVVVRPLADWSQRLDDSLVEVFPT